MELNVLSFNTQHCMNYITRKIDYKSVADLIIESGADIIGLNEIRGEGDLFEYEAQMEALASLTGYHYYFGPAILVCGKGPYGNGILSKYPIKSVEKIMIPDPEPKIHGQHYETRCILKATIDVGTDLTFMVSHFGLNLDERENAVKILLPALESEKCVFMGDLNTTPEEPILDGIRARMTDADDYLNGKLLSFPSDKPEIKIDYIFVSPDIKIKYADIPAKVVSDHRPYFARIEI